MGLVCWLVGHDWYSEQHGVSWCPRCGRHDIDYGMRPDLR